jgi:hypothetical protein
MDHFTGLDLNTSFDPSLSPFPPFFLNYFLLYLSFIRSASFDLYLNGELVNTGSDDGKTCDESELVSVFSRTSTSVFSLSYTFKFTQVVFRRKWSALAFHNVQISQLSMAEDNAVRFYPENSKYRLNCNIKILRISSTTIEHQSREVLHPQVFSSTETIEIEGSIGKVELDVFGDLTSLKALIMMVYNLRGFIHTNGLEWMEYLNYYQESFYPKLRLLENSTLSRDSTSKLDQNKVIVSVLSVTYTTSNSLLSSSYFPLANYSFPDEDFCLFASYPRNKMVFIVFRDNLQSNSCTQAWFYKEAVFYFEHGYDKEENWPYASFSTFDSISSYVKSFSLKNDTFEFAYNACKIPERIEKCKLASLSTSNYFDQYFQLYDLALGLEQARVVLLAYMGALLLFLCISDQHFGNSNNFEGSQERPARRQASSKAA